MIEVLIAAIAVWQIVEVWHHSLLFSSWRGWAETQDNRLGELLTCPFCMSVSLGIICVSVVSIPGDWLFAWWLYVPAKMAKFFVYGLAASRLANLGNDFFYDKCRTIKVGANIASYKEFYEGKANDGETGEPGNLEDDVRREIEQPLPADIAPGVSAGT